MRKFEWKKKNRQRSHMCGNKGYTLVELIVTFALLAIFMTAVVACLPNITKIYTNLQAINHQKTICNTVSNQIRNELQSTLGVEGADDALGVKNVNGKGYIALIDDSGQQIMIPTGGAVSTGGAILPASDLTGDTIEFVLRDGIIAQLDAKGFNGYTMRKNKLQVDYHDAKAISSGALLTRYYQTDGDYNKKLTVIDYKSGVYAVATEAGIVTEGEQNVAYAIEYPYAKPFYEGYELKTKFTIKKDAFYTYGDGTTASPARTYVNYINYTLSLWKDGHMKYSQDYVVNVQNAVPYLGTKAASDPVVPDVPDVPPGYSSEDTYIVEEPIEKVDGIHSDNNVFEAQYKFTIHIPTSGGLINSDDWWTIKIPDDMQLVAFTGIGNGNWFAGKADLENNSVKIYLNPQNSVHIGHIPETWLDVTIKVHDNDGTLFEDQKDALYGTKMLQMGYEMSRTSLNNTSVQIVTNNQWGGLELKMTSKEKRVKEYLEITYDTDIESVNDNTYFQYKIVGKKLYVYGRSIQEGASDQFQIKPVFIDHEYHAPVKVMVGDTQLSLD